MKALITFKQNIKSEWRRDEWWSHSIWFMKWPHDIDFFAKKHQRKVRIQWICHQYWIFHKYFMSYQWKAPLIIIIIVRDYALPLSKAEIYIAKRWRRLNVEHNNQINLLVSSGLSVLCGKNRTFEMKHLTHCPLTISSFIEENHIWVSNQSNENQFMVLLIFDYYSVDWNLYLYHLQKEQCKEEDKNQHLIGLSLGTSINVFYQRNGFANEQQILIHSIWHYIEFNQQTTGSDFLLYKNEKWET